VEGRIPVHLVRCMRGTLHLVPKQLKVALHLIYGDSVEEDDDGESEKKATTKSKISKSLANRNIPLEEVEALGEKIMAVVKKHGPQNSTTVKKHLPQKLIKKRKDNYGSYLNIGTAMRYLVSRGQLDYTSKPGDTWRKNQRVYALSTDPPSGSVNPQTLPEALKHIARWYFERYGPSSIDDFIWWSGCAVAQCRSVVEELKEEDLELVEVQDMEEKLFIFKHQVEELSLFPDEEPKMTRFLPYEDALIKAYKKTRYRFYDKEFEKELFTKGGEARPSVWMNGSIIGVWKWTNKPGKDIIISLCKKATSSVKKHLQEELSLVSAFLDASEIIWE